MQDKSLVSRDNTLVLRDKNLVSQVETLKRIGELQVSSIFGIIVNNEKSTKWHDNVNDSKYCISACIFQQRTKDRRIFYAVLSIYL